MNPQDNFRATSAQPPTDPSAYPPPPPAPGYGQPPQGGYAPQQGYAPSPYGGPPAYAPGPMMPPALQGRALAGWGVRFGASLIDGIFAFFTIGIGLIVNWFLQGREGEKNGMTLGKQVCNIRVVKEDGSPMSTGDGFVREFAVKFLLFGFVGGFFMGLPTLLDYLWPLWDEKNQALHDKVLSQYIVQA